MNNSKVYASSIDILGPTGAYIGSIGSTGNAITITGFNAVGPTGADGVDGKTGADGKIGPTGFISAVGTNYSDYVFWNGSAWVSGSTTVHIGSFTGQIDQQPNAVAIGNQAGQTDQQENAVAIGDTAGQSNQQPNAVAIGASAGQTSQQQSAVAIGNNAGNSNQGAFAVAIGNNAGLSNQPEQSIVVNASSTSYNGITGGCIINPIRSDNTKVGYLSYDNVTKEVVYNTNIMKGETGPTGPTLSISAGSTGKILMTNSGNVYYTDVLNLTSNNVLSTTCDIIPTASNVYDLGATGARWKEIYMGPGTLNITGPPGSAGPDATLGADANGIAYTQYGFASPFVNVGPDVGVPNSVGGWQLGPTGTPGSADFDLIVTRNTLAGLTGPAYSLIKNPLTLALGNTIRVDKVNGNNSQGLVDKYSYPFSTVQAAINASVVGDTVYIYPGQYEESITVKSGIAVRGINTQTVSIQKTNVLANTTLATLDTNCRLEDVTLNLTGATGGITLTGVRYINTAAQTAKLRTAVVNVSNYDPKPSVAYGILSDGTTTNTLIANSSNAVRAATINVNLGSTGSTGIGVFVNTNNRFTCRDTNVFANGPTGYDGNTGTSIIGGVVNAPSGSTGFLDLKCSTFSGATYDINRINGQIQLGFTDLVNNNANTNGFSVVTESSTTTFGVLGDLGGNQTYNLVPGTIRIQDLPNTPFQIPITQNMILFIGTVRFTGTIGSGTTVSLHIHKNLNVTPVYIITLNQGENTKINELTSVDFNKGDTYHAEVVTAGNPGTGTFSATLDFY